MIAMKQYEVPKRLMKMIERNSAENIHKMMSKQLDKSRHKEHFSNLLHLEEAEKKTDLRKYDLEGTTLTQSQGGRLLWLRVPEEKRPSLILGDTVVVLSPRYVFICQGFSLSVS